MNDDLDKHSFEDDLSAARTGDRKALDRLLTRLDQRLRDDAERRVGAALRGRTRVSDVLQDAYVEVVRSIPNFEGTQEGEFYGWVTAIIENAAKRQHRHLTAQKRKPPSRTTEYNALAAAYLRTVASPLSDLQRAEDVGLIFHALEDMRDDYRVAIEQIILCGRAIAEVAVDLGRTEQATRMLLSRARAALTVKLDQLHSEKGSS